MKRFLTRVTIAATPETTWALLVDAPGYPAWNTTVARIVGTIAPGETIRVHAKRNPGRAFPVKVVEFAPPRRMTWVGGMPLGLFRGVRTFSLTPQVDGRLEFTMDELFSGPLSPLFGRSIPDMQPAFDEFAAALKARAESAG